eukprot:XP_011682047.1 PREDICTED: monocarboxylate transporter 5-like [Strongylocentrotus purpuratus]
MTGSFLAPGGLLMASWATNNVELDVCLSVAGPVVAYLYQRLHGGYRRGLVMTGSFLAPGGLLMASWATNNVELDVCLSVAGLGSNILSVSLVITLSDQSGDAFGIFYGVGKSGYAFGIALVPLLADFLMDIYGWRGSLLIIGGIMAHLIPLTLMVDINAGASCTMIREAPVTVDEQSICGDTRLLQEASLLQRDKAPTDGFQADVTPANIATGSENGNDPMEEVNEETLRDDAKLMEGPSTSQRHQAISNLYRKGNNKVGQMNCSGLYAITCRILSDSIYNRDPWMILLMLVTMVFAMVDGGWHAFLIPRAVGRGISTTKALSLAYSAATAAFIGRCFGGLLLKYKIFSGQYWFLFLTFLNITSLLADIFVPKFALMIVTSFIMSITIAERNILLLVICKDRAPESEFPVILASSEIVFGLGAFLGASLSGYVADLTGTFNASFIFIAAVDAVVFCLMVPPIIAERSQEHDIITL